MKTTAQVPLYLGNCYIAGRKQLRAGGQSGPHYCPICANYTTLPAWLPIFFLRCVGVRCLYASKQGLGTCKCMWFLSWQVGPQCSRAYRRRTGLGHLCASGHGELWITQGSSRSVHVWERGLLRENDRQGVTSGNFHQPGYCRCR